MRATAGESGAMERGRVVRTVREASAGRGVESLAGPALRVTGGDFDSQAEPLPTRRRWRALTAWASVRRAIHEGFPPNRGTAAVTGLPLAPVGGKAPLEVAALTVDVDVEGIERRTPLGQRLGHHVAGMIKEFAHTGRGHAIGGRSPMATRSPQ